jgi:hypothetical protein
MVTLQREKLSGRGMLVSGFVRVSGGKYEINCYDEDGVKRAHGWFEVDQEKRSRWLDIRKAELERKKNGERLKLVITNLPAGSPIEFDVHEESILDLLSK